MQGGVHGDILLVSQQPERVVGFFNTYRQQYPVSRDVLRDKFLDPYFRKAKPNQVVAIVKGREPARIMIAIGNKKEIAGLCRSRSVG